MHGRANANQEHGTAFGASWPTAVAFLRAIAVRDYDGAGILLDDASALEGVGDVNGALSDVGRALLDFVEFEAGTIDVQDVVDTLAERAIELAGTTHCSDPDGLAALVVYLGSEGLPCAARSVVAGWSPLERREALVTLVTGLFALIARRRGWELTELVERLVPPEFPKAALGTFGLAWRGENGDVPPLAGALPAGYAPRITFLGEGTCTLRSIFARVAYLREQREGAEVPRQRLGAYVPARASA
ncbi:MAG: hypothetical protein JWL83_837 [Actinomycetia bacterium]|nr:hypothetical protein [Actinomycetes bacterium]